jgi:hypothetical protein
MKKMAKIRDFFLNLGLKWVWLNKPMSDMDYRAKAGSAGVEQYNSTLRDRASDILGFLNTALGFQGTGTKNYTFVEDDALKDMTLAIHRIDPDSDQPSWVEAQNILFQAAPDRLSFIKKQLEANVDNIKNDIAGNIANLFSAVQGKEQDLNQLESDLTGAVDFNDVLSKGSSLENQIINFDQIARDLADIYFSQFSLSNLDTRINDEIFKLLGKEGDTYSNGSTDEANGKYFLKYSRRDISDINIFNRYSDEIKVLFEAKNGQGSWSKENYLQKMFQDKNLELSASTRNAILADKNRKIKDFKNDDEILGLVSNFEDLMRIIGTTADNRAAKIDNLFKEHLAVYTLPPEMINMNDTNACLKHGLKQLETYTRDTKGDSAWDNGVENYQDFSVNFSILNISLGSLITSSKLKLDPGLIETIIRERNISSQDLNNFNSSADFLKILTQEELFTIAKSHYNTDDKGAALYLFGHNLKANTPIYYEDQRSIFDILNGKNNNNDDNNNINKIFSSMENQIKGLGETVKNLMVYGYNKPARNNLQQYLRNNPLEAAKYFENFTIDPNLSDEDKQALKNQLDGNIKKMLGRFDLMVTAQMIDENKDSADGLKELKLAIKNYKNEPGKNIRTIAEKFENLKAELKNKFHFEAWPENLSAPTIANLNAIGTEIEEDTKNINAHKGLYGSEMIEANKINAQQYGRKLPEPKADGSIPDVDMPIAPQIGPTLFSSVLVSLGNQTVSRAEAIVNNEYPDKNWLTDQSTFLKKLDQDLQTLPSDATRSQQFIEALKNALIPVIKNFLESKSNTKSAAESAKNNLLNNNTNIKKLNILAGTDSGFGFGSGDLDSDLNQIESDLGELMNPESLNINSNKISKAGLEDTKVFLENTARDLQGLILNPPEGSSIDDLQAKLSKVYDLLYGDNGNSANAETGSISERFTKFTNDVNSACSDKPDNMDKLTYLNSKQGNLISEYKTALVNFSDDITDISDDEKLNIETSFKSAMDNASNDLNGDGIADPGLDSDGNGVNDFMDLKNLANMISGGTNSLANTLQNVFATDTEIAGGGKTVGIKRLIMMMFLFSILEAGDWDYQRQEADTSRYQVW